MLPLLCPDQRHTRWIVTGVVLMHVWVLFGLQLPLTPPQAQPVAMELVLTHASAQPPPQPSPRLTTPTAAHAPIAQAATAQPAEVTPAHRVATPPQTVAPDASAAAGQRAAAAGATSGAPSGSVENSASHSAPAALSLPRSDALGLNNPAPVYPRLSRRLNEQGQVVIRVWVTTQGLPEHAEVKSSSGFDRLDQEALRTVQRWRFVPGQRGGAVEAMWFNVPVHFVLNQ